MTSSEPNNLRLPATSSNTLSGGSKLTIGVNLSPQLAKDSRLACSRDAARSNTCREAESASAVLNFVPATTPASTAARLEATTSN